MVDPDSRDHQDQDFREELRATAKLLCAAGKGILAADESTGTVGKRLASIGVANEVENRLALRHMLFSTPGIEQYISGVIMYEETMFQSKLDGKPLVDELSGFGILLGIKVDLGLKQLPGTEGETTVQGIENLGARCKKYYTRGARFAKWRAVLRLGDGLPSEEAVRENASGLAQYAAICQANGLVPIVEPEILMDGSHDLRTCQEATERVIAACYKALAEHHVMLEGTLLKPNMVTAGVDATSQPTAEEVGAATAQALQRTVPAAVAGITFLSGGQSEEQASANLNAINLAPGPKPWPLSFSFGRALQASALKKWGGHADGVEAAQGTFLARARANSLASLGRLGSIDGKAGGARALSRESLHVKDYAY